MSTTGVNESETKHVITPKVAIVENTNSVDNKNKGDLKKEAELTKPDQLPQAANQNAHSEVPVVNKAEENKAEEKKTDEKKIEEKKVGSDSEDEDDGAEEILEESPDKRWSKRREKVKQRDVPGVDVAYLAMDNETGNEVVWNEIQFSERKNFREQEEKLKAVFDNLTELTHINLVKFHKYWTDSKSEKPRIIFITEYLPSGSMFRFLQRARLSGTPNNIKNWKKWATQILSALNYLHSCDPPIVHGNLSCNTVFISNNGLVKIGCVAPNTINHHVKTCRENLKNMHYMAPEFDHLTEATVETDIYSFGICALEMATTGSLSNGSGTSDSQIIPDAIRKAIDSLEDPKQKDFIELCLERDPAKRPTARQLLSHQALFEVYKETRSIIQMQANMEGNYLKTVLRMDDMMNRQLMTEINKDDRAEDLAMDLVECGFICEADSTKICDLLRTVLSHSSNDE